MYVKINFYSSGLVLVWAPYPGWRFFTYIFIFFYFPIEDLLLGFRIFFDNHDNCEKRFLQFVLELHLLHLTDCFLLEHLRYQLQIMLGNSSKIMQKTNCRHFHNNYHLCEVLLYSLVAIRHLSQVMTASLSVENGQQTTGKSRREGDTFHRFLFLW